MIVLDPELNRNLKGVSLKALERFAGRARRAGGVRGEVQILITSNRALRMLNRQFRKKDKATDVLSFPPAQGVNHSGDIAISAEIAAQQARSLGHTLTQELKILMLHGILHLAGYDHETDKGEMARKEERLRRQLGLSLGLIQRTENTKKPARRSQAVRVKQQ